LPLPYYGDQPNLETHRHMHARRKLSKVCDMKELIEKLYGQFSGITDKDTKDASQATSTQRRRRHIQKVVPYNQVVMVATQSEALAQLARHGTLIVVGSAKAPKWLMMHCPCGCREILRISLSRAIRPAWRAKLTKSGTLSLYPSVNLESGCRAHFILRENRVYLL
jgi:hypothetical protein